MCRKIDIVLEMLETNDIEAMRTLLRQADLCATCPEQALVGTDKCSGQLWFQIELQNRLSYTLTAHKTESAGQRNNDTHLPSLQKTK